MGSVGGAMEPRQLECRACGWDHLVAGANFVGLPSLDWEKDTRRIPVRRAIPVTGAVERRRGKAP